MIKYIDIHDFRIFRDKKIILGKYLTAITGGNGTGKSTLLAMLAHSSQLTDKDHIYKPILLTNFKSQWSEIFKTSKFDKQQAKVFSVCFCDKNFNESTDLVSFRTTYQKESNRFRILPIRELEGRTSAKKVEWPVIYLGLSRLYPIGEADSLDSDELNLNLEDMEFYKNHYIEILSIHNEELTKITKSSLKGNKKKGVGIDTAQYDYLSNSAGQDNIGQILCAILSFKKLKADMGDRYIGGMLLIDEIESTLHPSAQINLIQFLIKQCKKLSIQAIFTTHSLPIIKNLTEKTIHNNKEDAINNELELLYLTTANRSLEIRRNPAYSYIECDLLIKLNMLPTNKTKVYSEDAENRWFLTFLLKEYTANVKLLEVTFGDDQLLSLYKADPEYFSTVLIVLDGDTPVKEIKKALKTAKIDFRNITQLPGKDSPEKVLFHFIDGLQKNDPFWKKNEDSGFTYRHFLEHGPLSSKYLKYKDEERLMYKHWLIDNKQLFNQIKILEYWVSKNKSTATKFRNNLIKICEELKNKKILNSNGL